MALITQKECIQCHNDFNAVNDQTVCGVCLNVIAAEKRKNHFNALDKLSLEERIRKIEVWIYDHKDAVNTLTHTTMKF